LVRIRDKIRCPDACLNPARKNYYLPSSNPTEHETSALLSLLIMISFFSIAQKTDTTKSTRIQMINKRIEMYNAQNFAALKNVYADM
jgi:hypothetical protein